jgi:hypothetical protein
MNNRVSSYIESLPHEQSMIAAQVRKLLWQQVFDIDERLSFNIPFYHYFGMFCYINTIPGGIDVGFCRGKDLLLAYPQLQMGKRKMVASLPLYSLQDIVSWQLPALILGAAEWQQECYQQKKGFVAAAKRRKK